MTLPQPNPGVPDPGTTTPDNPTPVTPVPVTQGPAGATPTGEQIKVAVGALRSDAKEVWQHVSSELHGAMSTAKGLDLTAVQFSYIGSKVGLVDTYQKLQAKLVTLLQQGADNAEHVADELIKAANTYEAEEQANVHKLNHVY